MFFDPHGDLGFDGLSEQRLGALAEDLVQRLSGLWQGDTRCVNFLHGGVLLEEKGVLVNTFLAKHTALFNSSPSTRFGYSSIPMLQFILIGLVVILVIGGLFLLKFKDDARRLKERHEKYLRMLEQLPDFNASQQWIGLLEPSSAIAIDEKRKAIVLLYLDDVVYRYAFSAVVSAEVLVDKVGVKVGRIALKITIHDMAHPLHYITFRNSPPASTDGILGPLIEAEMSHAKTWEARLKAISSRK